MEYLDQYRRPSEEEKQLRNYLAPRLDVSVEELMPLSKAELIDNYHMMLINAYNSMRNDAINQFRHLMENNKLPNLIGGYLSRDDVTSILGELGIEYPPGTSDDKVRQLIYDQ